MHKGNKLKENQPGTGNGFGTLLERTESAPGFFVTGNLYRPTNTQGKVPGVMLAHGHRKDARLYLTPEDTLRNQIADGAERFESAGRSTYQSQCRQLAQMGCVVWQWDMLGDSDSIQPSRELVHDSHVITALTRHYVRSSGFAYYQLFCTSCV